MRRLGAVLSWDEKEQEPIMLEDCWGCEACLLVCPRIEELDESKIQWIEGSHKDPFLGYISKVYQGRAKNNALPLVSEEEQAIMAIISQALEDGLIDGAILTKRSEQDPLKSEPFIAKSPDEVTSFVGISPIFLAFEKAFNEEGLRSLAVVGTPCQVTAARKIQMSNLGKLAKSIKLIVGIWCNSCINYPFLKRWVEQEEGPLNEVTNLDIEGGKLMAMLKNGDEISLWNTYCPDFAAEHADLSAGTAGAEEGRTLLLPRTDIGLKAMMNAANNGAIEIKEIDGERALTHARALSRKKKISSETIKPLNAYEKTIYTFNTLSQRIIETNACSQCAACYAVCPKKFPWIIPTQCEGCGECVKACNFDARELVKRLKYKGETECAWITHPERCVGCGECAAACIWGGTQMTRYINMAKHMYRDPAKHP